jgi:hypothetical protein
MKGELTCALKFSGLVLVQIIHHRCDQHITGLYAKILHEANWTRCADFVSRHSVMKGRGAYDLCEQGTFTASGSGHIAQRMRNVIETEFYCDRGGRRSGRGTLGEVCIVDAHAITDGRCNETHDGVHYSERVVHEELMRVSELTSQLLERS